MDTKTLILKADRLAREKGYNQSSWSTIAGFATNGQPVYRMMKCGDCRFSTFVQLLDSIGCVIEIRDAEGGNG